MSFDALSRQLTEANQNGTWTRTYDALGQRLTELGPGYPSGLPLTSDYGLAGNRLSQTAAGVQTLYSYDANNRMVSMNGAPVSYDANGNMTAFGSETLTCDVRNRLVGLTEPGTTASFVYDYANRRTSKTSNGMHTLLLNDGEDLVSEITSGTAVNTLQSPFVDEPIALNGLYFTPNHLGSTTPLTKSTGNLAEQCFYLPFGQTWQSTGTTRPSTNPSGFTGRESDGTGLYFCRNRYYSPDLGRFVSEDPMQATSDANMYAYAGADTVNEVDPAGLVHVVASVDVKTGLGTAKAYADPGDIIPAALKPAGSYLFPAVANGGELVFGPFNTSNHPGKGHTHFPVDTWTISDIPIPPNDPVSMRSGFIYLGLSGDDPFDHNKGLHGTGERPSWGCWTDGCIRCSDADLLVLAYLLTANGVRLSSHPRAVVQNHNTITFTLQ